MSAPLEQPVVALALGPLQVGEVRELQASFAEQSALTAASDDVCVAIAFAPGPHDALDALPEDGTLARWKPAEKEGHVLLEGLSEARVLGVEARAGGLWARVERREAKSPPNRLEEEAARLAVLLERAPLPSEARAVAERELAHLRRATPQSSEVARIRNYLEWLSELPWPEGDRRQSFAAGQFDEVRESLERLHVGLEDVKERVSEFLAVRLLGGGARGTVLCLVGPPGTGKSSMGRALARALGRPFLSIPVGAFMSERELVGISHRQENGRPGAILSGLSRCGAANPVVLLDELDKIALGGEGTSSGAFLQLLDPEQNAEFLDNYLGVPFDLSRALFLATANDSEAIPEALLDRMEVIEFNGYTEAEKYTIAREHLLPRARDHAGLTPAQLSITPAAIRELIRNYTEEAGVRELQRRLMALARKASVRAVRGQEVLRIKKGQFGELLGPPTVDDEPRLGAPAVGVSTGLAWTSAGGSLLPIETLRMPGSGRTVLTGQVGDVMRESVQTAISWLRSAFDRLGLEGDVLEELDLHLHFPSAATPKDGPSAGIAIACALVSLLSGRPARHDVALTGEMSLLGQVLPVGGLREKLLAAIRAGIREVVLPARNAEEIMRLSPDIRGPLILHLVDTVDEAVVLSLVRDGSKRSPTRPAGSGSRSARAKGLRNGKAKGTERHGS